MTCVGRGMEHRHGRIVQPSARRLGTRPVDTPSASWASRRTTRSISSAPFLGGIHLDEDDGRQIHGRVGIVKEAVRPLGQRQHVEEILLQPIEQRRQAGRGDGSSPAWSLTSSISLARLLPSSHAREARSPAAFALFARHSSAISCPRSRRAGPSCRAVPGSASKYPARRSGSTRSSRLCGPFEHRA